MSLSIFRKLDPKGKLRKYITGPCYWCGIDHTILHQGYTKFKRIAHKECFIKHNAHGRHLLGLQRRTKESVLSMVINSYKRSALRRKLEWKLTTMEFYYLSQNNCSYCGIEPQQTFAHDRKGSSKYIYNGLDRVDNKVGYTPENCVACCSQCNLSKRNLPLTTWLGYIKRLTTFNKDHIHD